MSKSGSTPSTPYPVAIFQDLSLIAMRRTSPLSLSAFPTPSFCPISVAREDISTPSVDGMITVSISTVYFRLNSAMAHSRAFCSCDFRTPTISTTDDCGVHKLATSKECAGEKNKKRTKENTIFFIGGVVYFTTETFSIPALWLSSRTFLPTAKSGVSESSSTR